MIEEILENLLGTNLGFVGFFGEARETLVGGCWGLLLSGVFLFAFFMALLALLFGITDTTFQVSRTASPVILLLCVSSLLSPIIGALLGALGGRYSVTRHIGCAGLWLMILLGAIFWLSTAL